MKPLLFLLLLISPAAFSQQKENTDYVVLSNDTESTESFFTKIQVPELKIDKNMNFTDTDRSIRRYYSYFSDPIDTKALFQDGRNAYHPDVFEEVTRIAQHDYFPQLP